ncbi:hypothetical protein [Rhizohabitans arisaemae]|uniref:hypothetical protein n=1 Tax=Rhizohabitans arisaemae TaxID=2720610 RepID=UPI0024B1F3CA|nr:hypothetical protein [Rhizohabitans arisaemae]
MRVKRWASLSASVLLAVGLVAGTAGAAHAVPTGCSRGISGSLYYTNCTGGTGEHRIFLIEAHWLPGSSMITTGPWQPPGTISSVLPLGRYVESAWIDKR